MPQVICPFCLQVHDFSVSLVCPASVLQGGAERVPAIFVRDYERVPPLWMTMVGFPKHGKTTYLATLNVLLENIDALVPGVYCRPLDGATMARIRVMREEPEAGRSAVSTPHNMARPLLFHMCNLPGFGSRCLVQYDVAGETYDSFGDVAHFAPALRRVDTAWFLISLRDLTEAGGGRTIGDLFSTYLASMEEVQVDVSGWNLIVIYTKADLLDLWAEPELHDYLIGDPFAGVAEANLRPDVASIALPQYMVELRTISDRLEAYTRRRVRGGAGFIAMVADQGMRLVFTLTSATSGSPDSTGIMQEKAVARRVIDPLLWALELSRPVALPTWRLVLAAAPGTVEASLPEAVWQALARRGEVFVHALGQSAALSAPGQPFPADRPIGWPRLIGPLLDQATPAERIVVLGADHLLDLSDFAGAAWRERLRLVRFEDRAIAGWPAAMLYRNGDSAKDLIESLLQL